MSNEEKIADLRRKILAALPTHMAAALHDLESLSYREGYDDGHEDGYNDGAGFSLEGGV